MDHATALEITTWAANEYAYGRRTGFAPAKSTPYSLEEVEEAVLVLNGADRLFPVTVGQPEREIGAYIAA